MLRHFWALRDPRQNLWWTRPLRVVGAADPQVLLTVFGCWLGEEAFGHGSYTRPAEAIEHCERPVEMDSRRGACQYALRRMVRGSQRLGECHAASERGAEADRPTDSAPAA